MDPNDKTIEEVAKAAAEVAKFGTQTISTTEKILGFAAKIFKEPAEQTSGIIGDRLRLYRWERQVAYVDKVNTILRQKNIRQTRAIPPKFALPILEGASLEDDEDLQQLWANLTANALDPTFTLNLRMTYIDIVKTLTPLDAHFLRVIYDMLAQVAPGGLGLRNPLDYHIRKNQLCRQLGIDSQEYEISVFNLFRAQCLAPAVVINPVMSIDGEPTTLYKGSKVVTMTPLGVDFVTSALQ